MFSSDRVLALNVGASKVVLAEFLVRSARPPELTNYGTVETGLDPDNEASVSSYLPGAIREIMRSRGMRPAPVMLSLSGQVVFPRYVKLPAVGREKLLQMVQYEVEQNVPFPLNEIVWNHQFIGNDASGEQGAMIVAAKIEHVREITDCVVKAGLDPEVVDVAPMALYNCLRYNYARLDGCTVLLDIGARSTNLIFVEDEKIYNRCIPVAGNTITLELAKSFHLSFAAAEAMKRQDAFVALGGVYASEDARVERISKIVRNVVTRLHAEISRSINFYRSQQGGAAPVRVLLTGGSAVLPHLDTFFREKMQVEVTHLNPFSNVGVGSRINRERAGQDAFVLAETVGLALRRSLACPVEINLMPPEILKSKSFKRRIPFFGLAAAGVLLSLGIWTLYERNMAALYTFQRDQVATRLEMRRQLQAALGEVERSKAATQKQADALRDVVALRSAWQRRVNAIRQSFFEGMWLTEMTPLRDEAGQVTGVRFAGRGWTDKLRQIQERAREAGRTATAVEELRDRIKAQAVFGTGPDDVRIVGVRDVEGYLIEFTIEALLTQAGASRDVTAP